MRHRPLITEWPQNVTVLLSETANLTCRFLSDLNPHVTWKRGLPDGKDETMEVGECCMVLDSGQNSELVKEDCRCMFVVHIFQGKGNIFVQGKR